MSEDQCPNFDTCKLVKTKLEDPSGGGFGNYLDDYCYSGTEQWSSCKRYLCKKAIHFCPDFVLPDTSLSIDEIIDKFDNVNH